MAWLQYHKKKWSLQAKQRSEQNSFGKRVRVGDSFERRGQAGGFRDMGRNPAPGTLGGFLRQAQQTLLNTPWQIIQVTVNTDILYRSVMKFYFVTFVFVSAFIKIISSLLMCLIFIQLSETNKPGVFKVWALVGQELHNIRLVVPRTFYINQRFPRPEPTADEATLWRKCSRILPRSHPVFNLYEYTVPEDLYQEHSQ